MADEGSWRRAVRCFSRQRDSDSEVAGDDFLPAHALGRRALVRANVKDAAKEASAVAAAGLSSTTLTSQFMWKLAMRMSFHNESRLLQHLSRSILSRSAHRHGDRKSLVEERSFFTRSSEVSLPPSPAASSLPAPLPAGSVKLLASTAHHSDPDAAASPETGVPSSSSSSSGSSSSSTGTATKVPFSPAHTLPPFPPLVFSQSRKTQKRSRGLTLREYVDWEHIGLRPGLSLRVVRAEIVGSMPSVTEYVMHVVDLHTKVFWFTKKRSSDISMLRRKIRGMIRKETDTEEQEELRFLLDLPFPRRRFRNASTDSLSRDMNEIELFLRNVAALEPATTLRRSLLQELQRELCSSEFITSLEHIDTTGEPPEPKWITYDLFRSLNSSATVEGSTCYKFLHAFANRCAVIEAAVCPMCHNFEDTSLSSEALRDLRTTVTSIEKYLLDHLDPRYADTLSLLDQSVDVQSMVAGCVCHAVEDTVLVPLEKQIAFLVGTTVDADVESRLSANIERMRHRSQTECGIPEHLQSDDDWGLSCHHLSMIDERPLPMDKIQELLRSALEIFKNCGEKNLEWRENSALTADDFLPIHIYVVVHSGLKRPLVTKELLGAMIHPSQMLGEVGYFLTMFEVALKYIADM